MIIPELTIYNFISNLIDYVNKDFQTNEESKTILYEMFKKDDRGYPLILNNIDYYQEAKNIILKNVASPRQLEMHLGFNVERVKFPTIHIHFPQETSESLEIGAGDGFYEPIRQSTNSYRAVYNRAYNASVFLFVTSDSVTECSILFNFLKNILLGAVDQLEFVGIRNFTISGEQLQLDDGLIPPNIVNRNLTLSFYYESSAPAMKINQTSNIIEFTPVMVPGIAGNSDL